MPRPRDGRCRNVRGGLFRGRPVRCGRRLPREAERSDLTARTDVCDRCARVKLAEFARSPAGRAWLARWNAAMNDLTRLVRGDGDPEVVMRLPPRGPAPSRGETGSIRLAGPTALARRPYRAGGRLALAGPLEAALTEDLARAVHRALLALPERTALILAMRFGIGPEEDEHTLAEIAEEVGLSKERARQLVREGIEELRWRLRKAV